MNAKVILFLFAVIVCAFLQLPSVSGSPPAPCRKPIEVGPCKARKLRFAYLLKIHNCVPFYYGGCEGNENNFATYQECEESCMWPR